MTEAMQITDSSEMEKRIDDSNSTARRKVREATFSSIDWDSSLINTVWRVSETTRAGHFAMTRPVRDSRGDLVPKLSRVQRSPAT